MQEQRTEIEVAETELDQKELGTVDNIKQVNLYIITFVIGI